MVTQSEQIIKKINFMHEKDHLVAWTTDYFLLRQHPITVHNLPNIKSFEKEYTYWNNDVELRVKELSLVLLLDEPFLKTIKLPESPNLKFKSIHLFLKNLENIYQYIEIFKPVCKVVHVYFSDEKTTSEQLGHISRVDKSIQYHKATCPEETLQKAISSEQFVMSQSEQIRKKIGFMSKRRHLVVWCADHLLKRNQPPNVHFLPYISNFEKEYDQWEKDKGLTRKELTLALFLDKKDWSTINMPRFTTLKFKHIHIFLPNEVSESTCTEILVQLCEVVHVYFTLANNINRDQLDNTRKEIQYHGVGKLTDVFDKVLLDEKFGTMTQSELIRNKIKDMKNQFHIAAWSTNYCHTSNHDHNIHILPGITDFEEEYNLWQKDKKLIGKELSLVLFLDKQFLPTIKLPKSPTLKFKYIHIFLTETKNMIEYITILVMACENLYIYLNATINEEQLRHTNKYKKNVHFYIAEEINQVFIQALLTNDGYSFSQ
jgi:hypothetical protein